MPIELHHDESRRVFEARLDGALGHLHYQRCHDASGRRCLRVPSVRVDPAIEGRGVAGALTRAALDWARSEGWVVDPICPYVSAWMRRHPEYDDLHDGRDTPAPEAVRPPLPFLVPCRALAWHAPFGWLRRGAADLSRARVESALFGFAVVVLSLGVLAMAWALGRFALLAALLSGFVFIAPLIGVGLYAISRRLEDGGRPSLRESHRVARRVVGQAALFALVQMVILLLWSRAGMMVYAFVPVEDGAPGSLWAFLALGSAFGSIFAALTFAVSVFSLPLIADREVDMVTASLSSINAVKHNLPAAATWALLIAVLTALGFATAFIGLAVVMPWLAYASWHAYREVLDASAWPRLEVAGLEGSSRSSR